MIGRAILHYEIRDRLGEGGMGVVYKAFDSHLDRLVAVKVLPTDKIADANRKRRFALRAIIIGPERMRHRLGTVFHPVSVQLKRISWCQQKPMWLAVERAASHNLTPSVYVGCQVEHPTGVRRNQCI